MDGPLTKRTAHHEESPVSPWIRAYARYAPARGCVLDVACDGGRNGREFLTNGYRVTFADIDCAGVADLEGRQDVTIVQKDLEDGSPWPFAPRSFDIVVVTNYLWRPRLADMIDTVAEGGLLLYETFAVGNEAYGRPKNPKFLLRPGELFDAVRGKMHVIAYEQTFRNDPSPAVIQHIAARK